MEKLVAIFEKESIDVNDKLLKFIKIMNEKNTEKDIEKPSELYVSTKSACCKLNILLNLNEVSKIIYNLILINNNDINYTFQAVQFKDLYLNNLNKKKKKKQLFYNSCTIVVKHNLRLINIKLFLNGSISMTGCKDDNDGLNAVKLLVNNIKKYDNIYKNIEDKGKVEIQDYRITLINSNYSINFNIIRQNLYELLQNKYKLFVSYEATRYPGVKISFMWNKNKPVHNGICECSTYCKGKGPQYDGNGENKCKKITIAIFQSGNIIITGSKSMEQTYDAYNYINKLLTKNYKKIVRYSIMDCVKDITSIS